MSQRLSSLEKLPIYCQVGELTGFVLYCCCSFLSSRRFCGDFRPSRITSVPQHGGSLRRLRTKGISNQYSPRSDFTNSTRPPHLIRAVHTQQPFHRQHRHWTKRTLYKLHQKYCQLLSHHVLEVVSIILRRQTRFKCLVATKKDEERSRSWNE